MNTKMAKLIVIALAVALAGCTSVPELDVAAEKATIEGVVHASIGWAKEKNKELLYQCMAQDTSFFIFNPDNAGNITSFASFQEMVEGFFMQAAFKAISYEVKDLRINLSRTGEAAWYSAILDDFNEWNGQPASWENVRWTGALEKRDGQWVIVQMHFSFATDAVES
ncbi:nuclear transport factor 2 family protein [Candidatus Neomarinimicrobiota bacterium]